METTLAHVLLSQIEVSESNKMFRDQDELSEVSLKELIASVNEQGVIQPVMLRPHPKPVGEIKYELVCGERRFQASRFAGLASIPANIRDLTNEEAFALQVTENLQRKDVHPLKEAHAYKYLVDKDPIKNTPSELALRFGKTEHYIHIRLKLNDLIPDAKKDFTDGIMTIGHAIVIARLTPEDQAHVIKACTDTLFRDKQKIRYYESVQQLQDTINDQIICNLNTAAFDKKDATLIPKVGACTTCPKHSGAGQLFADVSEKDRCFDRACFLAKRVTYMATQIENLLEKEPELSFLESSGGWNDSAKIDPQIQKALKENNVHVLQYNKDYDTYDNGNKSKIKGIYINGNEVGKRVTVYSTKAKIKANSLTPEKVDVKEAIARIDERLDRGKELDQEKVYSSVIELLQKNEDMAGSHKIPSLPELGLLAQIVYNHADFQTRQTIDKKLGFGKIKKGQEISEAFKKIAMPSLIWMVRQIAVNQYSSPMYHSSSEGILITEMARIFQIDVDEVLAKQNEVRKKREENAAKRKKELKPEKKKTATKTDKANTKSKAVKK